MLIIREKQLTAMGEARYCDEVAAVIREVFPEAANSPSSKLQQAVREQVSRAGKYGLDSESHVAAYAITAWLMGPNFDLEHKAAADVLTSPTLSPEDKTEWLEAWVDAIFAALEGEDE